MIHRINSTFRTRLTSPADLYASLLSGQFETLPVKQIRGKKKRALMNSANI